MQERELVSVPEKNVSSVRFICWVKLLKPQRCKEMKHAASLFFGQYLCQHQTVKPNFSINAREILA